MYRICKSHNHDKEITPCYKKLISVLHYEPKNLLFKANFSVSIAVFELFYWFSIMQIFFPVFYILRNCFYMLLFLKEISFIILIDTCFVYFSKTVNIVRLKFGTCKF